MYHLHRFLQIAFTLTSVPGLGGPGDTQRADWDHKIAPARMAQGTHLCHNNSAAEAADPVANCRKLEKAPPVKNWYLAADRSLFLLDAISGQFSWSVSRRVQDNLWKRKMDAGCLSCHAHAHALPWTGRLQSAFVCLGGSLWGDAIGEMSPAQVEISDRFV